MSPCDKSKFRDYVVLCPRASPRDAIPLALRLPRRYAPRNDTESGRFCLETDVMRYMRAFFAKYRSASSFKRSVPKIVPFSCKTYRFCHCEEGIFNARRGNLKRNETASRNEARQSLRDVALRQIKISGLRRFVPPCFATGCHTFGFKIATSLRSSQ